jgi:hypothetical protein
MVLLIGMVLLSLGSFFPLDADARVDVNAGINVVLPPYVVAEPPHVVVIPGTYVYYIPGIDVDIIFYHGYWYRPYQEYWYRAKFYNGPWAYLPPQRVPRPLLDLPPDYRHMPPGHQRIPYGQLKKSWKTWEKEKYWDKHEEKERYKEEKEKRKGKGKHRDD